MNLSNPRRAHGFARPSGSSDAETAPRSRSITKLAVATAALAMVASLAVPAQGQSGPVDPDLVVEAPRPVTTDPNPVRLFVSPSLAVHPDQPSTVVMAVGDARAGGCTLKMTRDGGLSWASAIPEMLPADQDFCVHRNFGPVTETAFAADGRLYVALSGSQVATGHPNGPITALVASTSDLGATHETNVVARPEGFIYTTEEGETLEGFYQWRLPSMAVDPNDPDRLYMGWRLWIDGIEGVSFRAFPQRSYISTSADGGRTWSEPVDVMRETISDAEAEQLGIVFSGELVTHADTPSMVVGSDGTLYAFTKERPNVPRGEPSPDSRLFMFRSSDAGQTFETTIVHPGAALIDNPSVAIGPDDTLYLTYASRGERADSDSPPNPSDVYVMVSTDGGETWSDPLDVGDDNPSRRTDQFFPGISVAPDGRVDLAWYDFRNDPFFVAGEAGNMGTAVGERYWDVYYSYSTDGGRTWSANVRATDRFVDGEVGVTFHNSDIRAPLAVASTDNAVYLAWADARVGGAENDAEDAYFTRIRFAAPPELGSGTGGGTSALAAGLTGAAITLVVGGLLLLGVAGSSRRSPTPSPAGK